jgi:hypothetical protein
MLTTINKPHWEYSARDWTIMFGALILRLRKKRVERKPQRPLWQQFDDTHHWDSTAEEWVRNDEQ